MTFRTFCFFAFLALSTTPALSEGPGENPGFGRFVAALEKVQKNTIRTVGEPFFTDAEDLGDGIVQLTASDLWLSGPAYDRRINLLTLVEMWRAADQTGLPVMIVIVDRSGKIHMKESSSR